jgi:hypothetical protein
LVPLTFLAIDRLAQAVERIYNIPARRRDLLAATRLKEAEIAAHDAESRLKSIQAERLLRAMDDTDTQTGGDWGYGGGVDPERSAERRLRRSFTVLEFRIEEVTEPAGIGHDAAPDLES